MVSDTQNVGSLDYPVCEIIHLGFHRKRQAWKKEGPSWSSQVHLQIKWCPYGSQIWSYLYYLIFPGDFWKVYFFTDPGPIAITSDLRLNHCWFIQAMQLDTSPWNILQMLRSYYCFLLEFLISTMFSSGLSRALPKLGNTFTMSFSCYCLL